MFDKSERFLYISRKLLKKAVHGLFHTRSRGIEPQPQVNSSYQDRGRVCFHKPNYFYIRGSTFLWISDKLVRSLDTLLTILRSVWHICISGYSLLNRSYVFSIFPSIPIMREICFTSPFHVRPHLLFFSLFEDGSRHAFSSIFTNYFMLRFY